MRLSAFTSLNRLLITNWLAGPLLFVYVLWSDGLVRGFAFGILWLMIDWFWDAATKVLMSRLETMQSKKTDARIGNWNAEQTLSMDFDSDPASEHVGAQLALTMILDLAVTLALPWVIALMLTHR